MVFSFFKKPPANEPKQPVARPKIATPKAAVPQIAVPQKPVPQAESPAPRKLDDLEFTTGNLPPAPAPKPARQKAPAAPPPAPVPAKENPSFTLEEFEQEFTDSSVMEINVDQDIDPLQSDIEQAVVLFANGQEAAARAQLELARRTYGGREGLRFWHLLFDLLQVLDDRAAFEKLSVEFAEVCEMSPPAWRKK